MHSIAEDLGYAHSTATRLGPKSEEWIDDVGVTELDEAYLAKYAAFSEFLLKRGE